MSVAARLSGFAAALVAVFAVALFAGGVIEPDAVGDETGGAPHASDPHGAAPAAGKPAHADEGHAAASAPQPVRGLSVADDGLALDLVDRAAPQGRATRIAFRITVRGGVAVTKFDVAHEKRMHLIVVRRDGRGFQHLHPTMTAEGYWSTAIKLELAGVYRVFADFTTDGTARTLAADLTVDGAARYRTFPESAPLAPAGSGYQVRLDTDPVRAGRPAELRFAVIKAGRSVKTQPYLGAGGHLVALRDGDLAYLHTHPSSHNEGEGGSGVTFESTFPSAGEYRLYFQFKHGNRVRTAEFTQEVTR